MSTTQENNDTLHWSFIKPCDGMKPVQSYGYSSRTVFRRGGVTITTTLIIPEKAAWYLIELCNNSLFELSEWIRKAEVDDWEMIRLMGALDSIGIK